MPTRKAPERTRPDRRQRLRWLWRIIRRMQRIEFHQLPRWVRIAAALTLFNTWILIAEFVIDRYGLDEHLPFYKYGDICVWEVAVIIGLTIWYVRASRVPRSAAATSAAT